MRSLTLRILFAAAIAGTALAAPAVASARTNFAVSFNVGDVAFAYRDGWWDRHHHFHHWRRHERSWYEVHYRTQYHDWDHSRDRDGGWHHPY